MKLAFNGLFLSRPFSGIGQYSRWLLASLADQADCQVVAFVPESPREPLPRSVETVVVPPSRSWLGRGVALDYWERRDLRAPIIASGAELYHAPYPTPQLDLTMPTVMTVHDAIPWQRPEYRRGMRRRLKLGRIASGIQSADYVLTVSQSAKADIVAALLVAETKIGVTYEAVDPQHAKPASARAIAAARRSVSLSRPYLVYLGGYELRKNVSLLIRSFAQSGLAASHDLLLIGSQAAPAASLYTSSTELITCASEAGVSQQVRTTGHVDATTKQALLSGAERLVFPSLAEGFGLPILEALQAGTPVLASDLAVHRELFGRAVTLVDPTSEVAWAKALRQPVRRPSAAAIRTIARRCNWSAVTTQTLAAYKATIAAS